MSQTHICRPSNLIVAGAKQGRGCCSIEIRWEQAAFKFAVCQPVKGVTNKATLKMSPRCLQRIAAVDKQLGFAIARGMGVDLAF